MLLFLMPQLFGQKRRYYVSLSYPGLLDLAFECHGQHPHPYEVMNHITYFSALLFHLLVEHRPRSMVPKSSLEGVRSEALLRDKIFSS